MGLQYLQQRYYDPAVGRFISPDPTGFAAGLNLYGYVNNDPVNGIDPLGLDGNSVTPYVRAAVGAALAKAARDPDGARADLQDLLNTLGGAVPEVEQFVYNALARVDRIQAGINFVSRIGQSSYATRLAQGISRPIEATCNRLVDAVARGQELIRVGIGTRNLGGGFYELRADNAARVILRQIGPKAYEIIGKFQGHVRGDEFNSGTIQRLISDALGR